MTGDTEAFGSKEVAVANARRLLARGDFALAAEQARDLVNGDPGDPVGYRLLGLALRGKGEASEAAIAEATAIELSLFHPDLFQAVMAIAENRLDKAEQLLRPYLQDQPDDPAAIRLLAEVAARTGNLKAADSLLTRSLALAPEYDAALELRSRLEKGAALPVASDAGVQYREALDLYAKVVERFPDSSENWISYGHILRTVGRQDDAVDAYRQAIRRKPDSGEAWWALADLKTRPLGLDDIGHMAGLLEEAELADQDRIGLHFALGKAMEQAGDHEQAFAHYRKGNRLRAAESGYDGQAVSRFVDQAIETFDEPYFRSRQGSGFDAADPIFILGMPRAGSTLIEQILSSHADIEGTMELPDMPAIASLLGGGKEAGLEDSDYLDKLAGLPPAELRKLGQAYLWGTRLRRQTGKPFFTDKMPNNWLHVGLILTVLPNARIIDARRHPLSCGLSLFRQHFAKGQEFSYDLADIGSFYADYVRMMDHFDRVMPGRVIRVIHEELVTDPDAEVRRLLDRLGLPFDAKCLRPHENRRAVRTASSEQVRQPISADAVEGWRPFAPWLGPLEAALGPIVESYPAAPSGG